MEHNQSKHYILLLNRVQQNNMAFYLKVSTQHKHKKFLVKSLSLISFAQIRRSLSLGGESSLVYHLERLHEKKGFADEIKWLRENQLLQTLAQMKINPYQIVRVRIGQNKKIQEIGKKVAEEEQSITKVQAQAKEVSDSRMSEQLLFLERPLEKTRSKSQQISSSCEFHLQNVDLDPTVQFIYQSQDDNEGRDKNQVEDINQQLKKLEEMRQDIERRRRKSDARLLNRFLQQQS